MDANQVNPKTSPTHRRSKKGDPNKPFIPRKSTTDTDRKRIVKAYLNGATAKPISDMLGIKLNTVYGILKQYKKTGQVYASRRGGNHPKILSKDAGQSIRKWLEEDNSLSLKQLADKVWDQYHVRVSASTVAREVGELRATLQRRKFMEHVRKWNAFATTEASLSNDDSVETSEYAVSVKEEYPSSSDGDGQYLSEIDVEETTLTHTDGWEQIVEPYTSEDIVNRSDSSENIPKPENDISAEERLNPIVTNEPNATSSSCKQQSYAKESHLQIKNETAEKCTFTMHRFDEPQTLKTVTVSMPQIQPVTDHTIEYPVRANVLNAPETCTHCTCFHQLVSEQKRMFAKFSTFEQQIVDGMRQMQESLMSKLKEIEQHAKDSKH